MIHWLLSGIHKALHKASLFPDSFIMKAEKISHHDDKYCLGSSQKKSGPPAWKTLSLRVPRKQVAY